MTIDSCETMEIGAWKIWKWSQLNVILLITFVYYYKLLVRMETFSSSLQIVWKKSIIILQWSCYTYTFLNENVE